MRVFAQQCCAAVSYRGMALDGEASLRRRGKLLLELRRIDMGGRFGKQKRGVRLQRVDDFYEERDWGRHFVHQGEGAYEINRTRNVCDVHRC